MNCKQKIEEYLDGITAEDIIFISRLYSEMFTQYSEMAFFKVMERMVKDKKLIRISKGIYARPNQESSQELSEETGQEKISEMHINTILNYYFGENNDTGMYIGYRLYQKYGITETDNGQIELYSNIIDQDTKNIGNISIRKAKTSLNYDNARIIEALEILQNYDRIEGLNRMKFALYARQYALSYNDECTVRLLADMKYKKGTIAFMKKILDMYDVRNSLGIYLNCASKYNVPEITKL